MGHAEKVTPVAAALAALATLTCCVPFAFAGAAAVGGLATLATEYRGWFIGASAALLLIGAVQVARRRACGVRSRISIAMLATSAAIVVLSAFFPQVMATLIADLLP